LHSFTPKRLELIQSLLASRGLKSEAGERIPRRSGGGPVPPSFAQERIWFLSRMAGESPVFNIPGIYRVRGRLDPGRLEQALAMVVRRHESLRTVFRTVDGNLVQEVRESVQLPLEHVDLRSLPAAEREAEALRRANEVARRTFDLARGPLARLALYRLEEEQHLLLLSIHHIVSEVQSLGVFVGDLACAYAGGELAELELQFADFALWQRGRMQGERLASELDFWKRELAGRGPDLDLPTDRPRPPVQTMTGGTRTRAFAPEVERNLRAFCAEAKVTPFTVCAAAWAILLARQTGAEDVCIGVPVTERDRAEIQGLIGFFVSTLVLHVELAGDPGLRELVRRVNRRWLDARAHQELPFEKLVDAVGATRDLARTPLFQVAFLYQTSAESERGQVRAQHGLEFEPHEDPLAVHTGTSKYDASLVVWDRPGALGASFEYNADLFDAETIERWLARLERLLAGALAAPDRPVSRLELLSDEERGQLAAWNATRSRYPRGATIAALFEAQVERRPEAVAAVFVPGEPGGETLRLSYRELNERANQVAHHLRGLGVKPDELVGLCAERTLPMLVGILGIVKAGGAYLPLDPGYPEERLRFMIEDAELSVLLVQEKLRGSLPPVTAKVVALDGKDAPFAGLSRANPPGVGSSSSLAYAMFTSGSTGRPKGVLIEQKSVLRLVMDPNFAQLGEDEVLLHFAPISFDASTLEVWGALLRGGRMVVYPPTQPSLEELGRVLREHGVTTAWLTAGLFSLMVDQRLEDLRGLRQLLAGGDVLPVPQVNRVLESLPGLRLINGYGPTENTTFTCCHTISGKVTGAVPIGKPISDTRVHVLDEHGEPVPIGVYGELFAGGDGVARGYLKRPELTAEKFVADRFSGEAGGRLYRTGDVVRWRSDGTVEFQGRRDGQVKVRGFRIELGEIEAALGSLAGVRACTVIVREDSPGDKRIVAYVVGAQAPEGAQLTRALAAKLPQYMVPAHFVRLEALPLSPNGKVDRKRLPAPDWSSASSAEYEAPRNEVERRIATIWSEVLGVERVGIHDNFFELGGNSLLSTQAVSRIRKAFQVELPLRELFQEPTVAGLATRVGGGSGGEVERRSYETSFEACLIPLQPRGWRPPLFLVSGAHADEDDFLRFVGSLLPHMQRDQPIYGFKARGLDGVREPHTCAEEMAADYIREMRAFRPSGPYLIAGNCVGGIVAFEMARQLRAAGEQAALVALLDTTCPLDDYQAFVDHHYRFWKLERFIGHWRKLAELSLRERLRYVRERMARKLRRLLPASDEQRRRNRIESVERQYSMILARYRPLPYPGQVTLIVNEELQRTLPDAGWRPYCGSVETHVVPGDHVTRLSLNAGVSAEILGECIARALSASGASEAPPVRTAAG
jgi:amino acid adenylation domain-containing protein